MNKKLSLVLAIVMLFSVFAIPAAVSAAATDVTLTIATDKGTYYAGDIVTVTVNANTAEGETTFTNSQVVLTYDSTNLSLNATEDVVSGTLANTVAYNKYANAALTLNASPVELFTATFTVLDAATVGDITFVFNADLTGFANADPIVKANVTAAPATANIAASSIAAKYATATTAEYADITSGLSITDTSMTVKVEAVGNVEYANLFLGDATEATADLKGGSAYEITTTGNYTIKAKVKGAAEVVSTFAFTLKEAEQVVANLALTAPADNANGFKANAAVSMPVVISGMAEGMTAAMVKFTVEYTPAVLTLNTEETASVTYTKEADGKYTVLFESEADPVANDGTVVALPFTVAANAVVGTTEVTITAVDWAKYTTEVDWSSYSINTTVPTVGVTVIPDGAFATLPSDVMEEDYTNEAYTVEVTPAAGVEVKYAAGANIDTTDVTALYNNANALTEGAVSIDNEAFTYVVIAKVGTNPAVYSIVKILTPGAGNWLDTTVPTVNITDYKAPSVWTSTVDKAAELDVSAIITDDDATLQYSLTNGEDFAAIEDSKIIIPAKTTIEAVYLKAVDKAGNASASTSIAVKYDGEVPEVSADPGSLTANGREIAIEASDNKELASVKIYYSANDANLVDVAEIEALENGVEVTKSYEAQQPGYYYVVATDAAGAKAATGAINISLDKVNAAGVKATIVKDGELKAGLVAGETINNGYFTYIKIEADEVADGYTTTLSLAKDNNTAEEVAEVELTNAAPGAYTLTVTTAEDGNEANNFGTAVYKFNIAANQAGMKSVDNNSFYNVYDLAVLNNYVSKYIGEIKDYEYFESGLYSADVDGSLSYSIDDADAVLGALKAVQFTGLYKFAIMNGVE